MLLRAVPVCAVLVTAAVVATGCSNDHPTSSAALDETLSVDPEGGVIPSDQFVARATEIAGQLTLPQGYDLRLDLIAPTTIGARTLESALRFRAVCVWTHYAAGSDPGDEAWSAAADHAAALVQPLDRAGDERAPRRGPRSSTRSRTPIAPPPSSS